jgi:hypothetical protein
MYELALPGSKPAYTKDTSSFLDEVQPTAFMFGIRSFRPLKRMWLHESM